MQRLSILLITFSVSLAAQPADQMLTNGKIVTVDQDFSIAEAIAIRGDRIIAVGSNSEVLKHRGPSTQTRDLDGQTVIPGLIDNHFHFIRAVQRWHQQARIDGVASRAKALEIIAAKAASLDPGEWLWVQGGWSEGQFDKKGGFTLDELDTAAPHNPLFLQQTYRAVYANSRALVAAGLDPSAGAMQRGRPAINRFNRLLPQPDPKQIEQNLHDFVHELNKSGLTALQAYGRPTEGDINLVREVDSIPLRVYHSLRYRANDAAGVDDAIKLIESSKPFQRDESFGLLGLGEHIYGPMSDRTTTVEHWSPDIVDQFMRIAAVAAKGGWQIHEHTMADVTIRNLLDPFEELHKKTPIDKLRWTFAHVDTISPESIARAKKLGMVLAVHGKSMHQAWGLRRQMGDAVSGIPPLSDMQQGGIVWGLGTDATIVSHYQPFITLGWAVTGKSLDGTKVLDKTVSREDALIAHTRSNAHILFMENDLGTLEAGKLADLVVLDRDYLSVPADDIMGIMPILTMVGGKVAYER